MSYIINNTRGQIIAVVEDGTTDTTATSQTLIGKNVTPYGEINMENLVHQLENFADSSPPPNPIEGQLWYDIDEKQIYAWSGSEWRPVSGLTVSVGEPDLDARTGDLWFNPSTQQLEIYSPVPAGGSAWIPVSKVITANTQPAGSVSGELYFNTVSSQLFAYNGTSWNLIGPDGVSGFATTRWVSSSLLDTNDTEHAVILCTVDGEVVAISSSDTFVIRADQRPPGFSLMVPGINLSSSTALNGRSFASDKLSEARLINGVPFDGTSNITIGNAGELLAGNYLLGSPYAGTVPVTWAVDASVANQPDKVVARDNAGNFSAGTITAQLNGNVSGTATNVTGIVASANGGTGISGYAPGQILFGGPAGTLTAGTIAGSGPIQVNSTGLGITISYTGGTGSGTVTEVGLLAGGDGIAVTGSPITSSGNITINNTGVTRLNGGAGIGVNQTNGNVTVTNTGVREIVAGTNIFVSSANGVVTISSSGGGGGGGTVTAITAGDGLSGGTITTTGTISVNSSVIRTNGEQTIAGLKTYTGGIVSQAYNFTPTGNSIFYVSSPAPTVQVAVSNEFATYFYPQRLVVEGNSDGVSGERQRGGTIVGVDNGILGGTGVWGITTTNLSGYGQGLNATATGAAFTGACLQTVGSRGISTSYQHIRSYSAATPVFVVNGQGDVNARTFTPSGADYAEFFEWWDGNSNNEDRIGISVTLQGDKIRPANPGDALLGVVSSNPAMAGDSAELYWKNQFVLDEFGRQVFETYFAWEWIDSNGRRESIASFNITKETKIPDDAVKIELDQDGQPLRRPKINPAYDPDRKYVPRSQRPEWSPVGLIGKLRLRRGQPTAPNWIKLRDISDSVEEWLIRS